MNNSFLPFPELETTRLKLRQLDQTDAQDVFDIRKRVNEFVDYKRATSIADAEAFIEKIRHFAATGEGLTWAISFKDDPKLAGTIVYWNISEDRLVAEIGYELATAYQGKGIMQEVMQPVIDYGFNVLNFKTIEAHTYPGHARSLNLLSKFGFKPVPNNRSADPEVIYILSNPKS